MAGGVFAWMEKESGSVSALRPARSMTWRVSVAVPVAAVRGTVSVFGVVVVSGKANVSVAAARTGDSVDVTLLTPAKEAAVYVATIFDPAMTVLPAAGAVDTVTVGRSPLKTRAALASIVALERVSTTPPMVIGASARARARESTETWSKTSVPFSTVASVLCVVSGLRGSYEEMTRSPFTAPGVRRKIVPAPPSSTAAPSAVT